MEKIFTYNNKGGIEYDVFRGARSKAENNWKLKSRYDKGLHMLLSLKRRLNVASLTIRCSRSPTSLPNRVCGMLTSHTRDTNKHPKNEIPPISAQDIRDSSGRPIVQQGSHATCCVNSSSKNSTAFLLSALKFYILEFLHLIPIDSIYSVFLLAEIL